MLLSKSCNHRSERTHSFSLTALNICGAFAEQMLQHYALIIINETGYSGRDRCVRIAYSLLSVTGKKKLVSMAPR